MYTCITINVCVYCEKENIKHILTYLLMIAIFIYLSIFFSGKSEFTHVAMETYITTDTHKCYAMLSPPHQMYALYNTTVPTFAMR